MKNQARFLGQSAQERAAATATPSNSQSGDDPGTLRNQAGYYPTCSPLPAAPPSSSGTMYSLLTTSASPSSPSKLPPGELWTMSTISSGVAAGSPRRPFLAGAEGLSATSSATSSTTAPERRRATPENQRPRLRGSDNSDAPQAWV